MTNFEVSAVIRGHPEKTNGESEQRPPLNTSKTSFFGPKMVPGSQEGLERTTTGPQGPGPRGADVKTHLGRGELTNQIPTPGSTAKRRPF